jgi:CBS domain-containing protein
MKVIDVVGASSWTDRDSGTLQWLARLLRDEGVDLMNATSCEMQRGTPVYVDGDADVVQVQRLMAQNHIRSLPVVDRGGLVGVVDIVDLAMMEHEPGGPPES